MQELTIRAYAPEDGWAIAEIDGKLFLVRPPYLKDEVRQVDSSVVARSLAMGFVAISESFKNWNDVISFLNRSVVASREALPEPGESAAKLIKNAPADLVSSLIDRVETEMGRGRLTAAPSMLAELLSSQACGRDESLKVRVVGVLRQAIKAQLDHKQAMTKLDSETMLAQVGMRFPFATRKYGAKSICETSKAIADRRQVFAMARQ